MVEEDHQPPSELSSPSSMNESDRRLLLLAAVSQREQQLGMPPPAGVEESSTAVVSKASPYTYYVTDAASAGAALSKNIAAVGDVTDEMITKGAVATLSPKKPQLSSEAINVNNGSADPTTFTLNEDEDIMVQLRRSGLDQVKIPPLYSSTEPLPPLVHDNKRKVSEDTRDASKCGGRLNSPSAASSRSRNQANKGQMFLPNIVTGGSSPHSTRQTAMSSSTSFSALPAPPLGRNFSGCQGSIQGRGGAASVQNWGHDYHQHIMSMSMAGLSAPNRMMLYNMAQGDPQQGQHLDGLPPSSSNSKGRESSKVAGEHGVHDLPQQQQMQHRPKKQKLKASDEGPKKKRKKKKKNDDDDIITIPRRATKQDVQKYNTTTKDGKPIVFPNQEIYSQILRKKELSSKPRKNPPKAAAEALTAQIVPFSNNWKDDEAERTRRAAPSSKSAAGATLPSSSPKPPAAAAAAAPPPPSSRWKPSLQS